MKISRFVLLAAALVLFASCDKQQSQADRDAEVERRVQERLAAEQQATQQQALAQQAADLDAREKALAATQTASSTPRTTATPRHEVVTQSRSRVTTSEKSTPRGYETFYRKLEPYGAWKETGDYGYVWQPQQAQRSRNWRPYTDGRWAYTDAGWTWVSEEPFGWATYHYGRWTRLSGMGWVWVPGDQWAPAWVSWREGGDHVGWAPLPPEARFEKRTGIKKWADSYYDIDADEYVFIPDENIGAENVRQYAIPQERNVTIVNQTTNVTNITYSNDYVVNEGPNYDEMRSRSRQPVPQLRLNREYEVREDQASTRAQIVGDTIAMLAPLFTDRAAERPRTEGGVVNERRAERSWTTGGNQAEAQQARQKMQSEATPPPDAPSRHFERPVIATGTPAPTAAATAATATPVTAATPVTTPTPTATPIATASPTATVARRPISTPTPTPIATATPSATATATPIATATPTPTPAPTATPVATATPTPTATPIATATPTPTPRATPTPTPTAIATATPRATATPIATATPEESATPARVIPTPRSTPVTAPPVATPDASASAIPGGDPRETAREQAMHNAGQELLRKSGRQQPPASPPTATAAEIAPARAVTPRPVATPVPAATPLEATPAEATPALKPQPRAIPPAAVPTATPAESPATAEEAAPENGPRGRGHPRGGLRAQPGDSPAATATPEGRNED
ncbi:MAG: hypothetical protein M3032_12990 [Verrucomicrobiota bacterium]|nr:hypothetical protein [Verrucomicrobiota bacterium]